ncbi:MAG: LacI family DNA-binding transcriptional regulator [Chthoniobacterales bacterium]
MITQKKIAEHLNLSRSTVANILGGEKHQKYNKDTRERVLRTSEEFGYRVNRISRSVRTGRSNLIGVVHFNLEYEVTRTMMSDLSQALDARGFGILSEDLSWQGERTMRAVEQLVEARVEGVVIVATTQAFDSKPTSLLQRAGIPAITLFGNEKLGLPSVYEDHRLAMRTMTEHVIAQGHRHIVLLLSLNDIRPIYNNILGFKEALHSCEGTVSNSAFHAEDRNTAGKGSLPVGYITQLEHHAYSADLGIEARNYMRDAIKNNALPDVIICQNDQWAIAVIGTALAAGLRVPEDVAVTGIDNENFGSHPPYELTTLAKPITEGCKKAADIIVAMIRGELPKREDVILPCKLIVRRSCGATRGRCD